jgi:tRNA pseudouridine55 synthase
MSISAGGYVRSVAHELGQDLGCGAHLSSLRRTQAGVFTLAEAHTLDELQPLAGNEKRWRRCACIRAAAAGDALGDRRCAGSGTAAQRRAGQLPEFSSAPLVKVFAGQRELVGIAKRVAGTLFQPVVVMG